MTGAEILVAALLLAIVPVGVVEAFGYRRGQFMTAFWRSSMDDRLDQIAANHRSWWVMGLSWVATVATTVAGMAGFGGLLDEAGATVLAWCATALFGLAGAAWLLGTAIQTAGIASAARVRSSTGETPTWAHAVWMVSYVAESAWIALGSLAFVLFGAAILQTDVVSAWAGWVAIVLGVVVPAGVLATREGFPHLTLLVPLVLAVALLIG